MITTQMPYPFYMIFSSFFKLPGHLFSAHFSMGHFFLTSYSLQILNVNHLPIIISFYA